MANFGDRQVILVLVGSLLAITLAAVGCGGGGDGETSTTASTVPTTDTTVVEKEEIEGKEIIPGDDTPGEIRSALERNRPLLVFFYVPGGTDDGLVEDAVDDLEVKFADIFFARYDYRRPQLYGDLAELVGVEYAPTVVMIDAGGYVSKAFSGYVDEGSLNQVLTNIR